MIDKIISFIKDNGEGYHKNLQGLEEYIHKHIAYKTCNIIYNELGEVVALSRWNIIGDSAHILDVIIRQDSRNKGLLKRLIKLGHKTFPEVKYIVFERESRKDKRVRKISIGRLLK